MKAEQAMNEFVAEILSLEIGRSSMAFAISNMVRASVDRMHPVIRLRGIRSTRLGLISKKAIYQRHLPYNIHISLTPPLPNTPRSFTRS